MSTPAIQHYYLSGVHTCLLLPARNLNHPRLPFKRWQRHIANATELSFLIFTTKSITTDADKMFLGSSFQQISSYRISHGSSVDPRIIFSLPIYRRSRWEVGRMAIRFSNIFNSQGGLSYFYFLVSAASNRNIVPVELSHGFTSIESGNGAKPYRPTSVSR